MFKITVLHNKDGENVGVNGSDGGLNDNNDGLNGGLNQELLALITHNNTITVKAWSY